MGLVCCEKFAHRTPYYLRCQPHRLGEFCDGFLGGSLPRRLLSDLPKLYMPTLLQLNELLFAYEPFSPGCHRPEPETRAPHRFVVLPSELSGTCTVPRTTIPYSHSVLLSWFSPHPRCRGQSDPPTADVKCSRDLRIWSLPIAPVKAFFSATAVSLQTSALHR